MPWLWALVLTCVKSCEEAPLARRDNMTGAKG